MHRNDRLIIFIGLIVVVIALIGAAIGGKPLVPDEPDEDSEPYYNWPLHMSELKHMTGSSTENSDSQVQINISDKYVTRVIIELKWEDEPNAAGLGDYQNQPDSFNFTVYTPWDEELSSEDKFNSADGAGIITEEVVVPEQGIVDGALGEWTVNIHCDECGDQEPRVSITGLRVIADTGNDWVLTYQYEFHADH